MISMKVKLNGNNWYEVTSDFGEISNIHPNGHNGIDLAMPIGTKIYSPVDGIVEKIVDFGNDNIGRGIYLKTHNNTMIFGHLSDIEVRPGEEISAGELIGISGNTGHSTGPHLHIGLKDATGKFVDPDRYLAVHNDGNFITDIVNGFDRFFLFLDDVREHGIFYAIYGKSFFEVVKDFVIGLLRDLAAFILKNGDLFFLLPAITFMFITFIIGRNKYTRWIIPLWFFYFISVVAYKLLVR